MANITKAIALDETLQKVASSIKNIENNIQYVKGNTGEQGPKGDKGDTGEQGPKGDKGDTGEQGLKGNDGYTPQRGIDYWTSNDIETIQKYIDNQLVPINNELSSLTTVSEEG